MKVLKEVLNFCPPVQNMHGDNVEDFIIWLFSQFVSQYVGLIINDDLDH